MNAVRGFTMVELMITLVIAAILVAIAVPSFQETIRNNQMINSANATVGALQYARTQAVSRANSVYLGPRNGANWNDGLVVWFDKNDAGNSIGNYEAGEELRIWERFGGDLALTTTANQYEFLSTGALSTNANMTLCDTGRTGETGRTIEILISGMISINELTCN